MNTQIWSKYSIEMGIFAKTSLLYFAIMKRYRDTHPVTYADIDIESNYFDTVLTAPEDQGSCLTLDYIFEYYQNQEDFDYDSKVLRL